MKMRDLRDLSSAELADKEREIREEIFHSKLKYLSGELNNTAKLRIDRRALARVKTLLAQKRKAEAK